MLPHLVWKRLRAAWRLGLASVAAVTLGSAFALGYGPHPVRWSIPVRTQAVVITAILVLVVVAWVLRRLASTRAERGPWAHLLLSVVAYGAALAISGFGLVGAVLGASPQNVYPACLVSAATLSILKPFRHEVDRT